MIVCLTTDAYKMVVNSHTADFKTIYEQVAIDEVVLAKKLKNYKINREDSKIRIFKPKYREGRFYDLSVCLSESNGVLEWDRG